MDQDLWTAIDHYLVQHLIPPDPALDEALRSNAAAGLPAIDVAPNQGKLLHLFARMQSARRILEIGTLGGYSTIWLARTLPTGGKLITLESDARHAQVAAINIDRAGLSAVVEIRLAPALESLAQLHQEKPDPFDLIFVDADKPNNPLYLEWAIRLSRPGTIILMDNVIREGAILDPNHADVAVQATRSLFAAISADPRLEATALQTVGSKGYDGFAIALVKST